MQGQVVDVPQTDGTSHSGQVEAEDLVLEIGSDDAWRALGSPYRMRLFELIRRSGTITITELAPLAGTNPVNLYYHVHTLQNAGLIKAAGHRPGVARRAPKTYMANGNRMVVRYDPRNEMHCQRINSIRRNWLRESREEIESAAHRNNQGGEEPFNLELRWEYLPQEDLVELEQLMSRAREILDRCHNENIQYRPGLNLVHTGFKLAQCSDMALPAPHFEAVPVQPTHSSNGTTAH